MVGKPLPYKIREELPAWAKVKFGLKPTLRLVHVVTLRGRSANEAAYSIAEKQLYSSHTSRPRWTSHFVSAALTIQSSLVFKAMGSEQAGLTGVKGSIVRKVAVGRSASQLLPERPF